MRTPFECVEYIKQGGNLSQNELDSLREVLVSSCGCNHDIYDAARGFALAVEPMEENIVLVEKYLHDDTDDWNLQGVIYALGYWGIEERYIDKYLEFSGYHRWEHKDASVIASLSALGKYIYTHKDYIVLSVLFRRFMCALKTVDHDKKYDKDYLSILYASLDRAVRGRDAQLANITGVKIPEDIDNNLLTRIEQLTIVVRKKH